jgi:hypothetical protein
VPLGLDVAVGVRGPAYRRVPHLLLHPPEIGAVRQEPRRVGVPGRVVLPIRQAGREQERPPDELEEVPVAEDPAVTS